MPGDLLQAGDVILLNLLSCERGHSLWEAAMHAGIGKLPFLVQSWH